MRARVEREFARWRFTHDQVLALEKERRDRTKDETKPSLEKVRALYAVKGIGLGRRVMDGMHRVAKALLQGNDVIEAVQFERDPEPDYVGCRPEDLPY